jgi:hypothetical protein
MRRDAAVIASMLSMALSSCYSNACGSEHCLHQEVYANTKRCSAVFGATVMILQTAARSNQATFQTGAIEDLQMQSLDFALQHGAALGMPRAAIYEDVERAKLAYLNSYNTKQGSPRQKLEDVIKDVNACAKNDGLGEAA